MQPRCEICDRPKNEIEAGGHRLIESRYANICSRCQNADNAVASKVGGHTAPHTLHSA